MLGQATQQAAKFGGGGEQHGRLAFDHGQVGGLVDVGIADIEQLQHLALGDGVGGVGQDAHDAHVVQLDHQLERARVQEVADQHAGGVAPQRVGGLAAAAQVRLVHHVVVQQGGGMDELDHRRQLDVLIAAVAGRARRQHMQHRTQALAAAGDDVVRDLVDQHHVRGEAGPDQGVDALHVTGSERSYGGEIGGAAGVGGSRCHG